MLDEVFRIRQIRSGVDDAGLARGDEFADAVEHAAFEFQDPGSVEPAAEIADCGVGVPRHADVDAFRFLRL